MGAIIAWLMRLFHVFCGAVICIFFSSLFLLRRDFVRKHHVIVLHYPFENCHVTRYSATWRWSQKTFLLLPAATSVTIFHCFHGVFIFWDILVMFLSWPRSLNCWGSDGRSLLVWRVAAWFINNKAAVCCCLTCRFRSVQTMVQSKGLNRKPNKNTERS